MHLAGCPLGPRSTFSRSLARSCWIQMHPLSLLRGPDISVPISQRGGNTRRAWRAPQAPSTPAAPGGLRPHSSSVNVAYFSTAGGLLSASRGAPARAAVGGPGAPSPARPGRHRAHFASFFLSRPCSFLISARPLHCFFRAGPLDSDLELVRVAEEMKGVENERKGVDAAIAKLLEREQQLMERGQQSQLTKGEELELASVRDDKSRLRDKENKLLDTENKIRDERLLLLTKSARPASGACVRLSSPTTLDTPIIECRRSNKFPPSLPPSLRRCAHP